MARRQCVSDAFEVNAGVLEVKDGCNDGATWPYSCAVASYNGLRVTDEGCLYVSPDGVPDIGWASATTDFSASVTTDTPHSYLIQSKTFTNANDCWPLYYTVYIWMQWVVDAGAASSFGLAKKISGQYGGSDPSFHLLWDSESTVAYRRIVATQTGVQVYLLPGESTTVTAEMMTIANLGTATVTRYNSHFGWLGVPY